MSYRLKEIELLESDTFLVKEDRHKSLFQLLPRHMRRRTMGYIRKRLPRKIRNQAIIKLVRIKLNYVCQIYYSTFFFNTAK
jgi:hypothetical protein